MPKTTIVIDLAQHPFHVPAVLFFVSTTPFSEKMRQRILSLNQSAREFDKGELFQAIYFITVPSLEDRLLIDGEVNSLLSQDKVMERFPEDLAVMASLIGNGMLYEERDDGYLVRDLVRLWHRTQELYIDLHGNPFSRELETALVLALTKPRATD